MDGENRSDTSEQNLYKDRGTKSETILMTTFDKLAKKYFKKTGHSPEQSFFAWLLSLCIEPKEKELKKVLKDFDKIVSIYRIAQ